MGEGEGAYGRGGTIGRGGLGIYGRGGPNLVTHVGTSINNSIGDGKGVGWFPSRFF